jgi:UDP-N-acetylenolpyruvoylglucosamine reductase
VLVNYDDCPASDNAKDILDLAAAIQKKVLANFGIDLEIEPRVYGFI